MMRPSSKSPPPQNKRSSPVMKGYARCFFIWLPIQIGIMYGLIIFFQGSTFDKFVYQANSSENVWDEPNLFNLNFTWLKNNESVCTQDYYTDQEEKDVLPVLVHSARSNFAERQIIRDTWGSLTGYGNLSIRVIFLLGDYNPTTGVIKEVEEQKLNEEQEMFGDLVIGSFIESPENASYKHMMGFKWVLSFCKHSAKYLIKVDDNIFINIFQFIDQLKIGGNEGKDYKNFISLRVSDIHCKLIGHQKPNRNVSSPNYISYTKWPYDYFPGFCRGWVYSIKVNLVEKLYTAWEESEKFSNHSKLIQVDPDAFLAGLQMRMLVHDENEPTAAPTVTDLRHDAPTKLYRNVHNFLCNNERRKKAIPKALKTVMKVKLGKGFKQDMYCLWKKTVDKFLQSFNKFNR